MVLVDTSVWIDHLRAGRSDLARLLDDGLVLGHPWVAGELALGHLVRRNEIAGRGRRHSRWLRTHMN